MDDDYYNVDRQIQSGFDAGLRILQTTLSIEALIHLIINLTWG